MESRWASAMASTSEASARRISTSAITRGSSRSVTQCPAHHSRVSRFGKPPLPLSNEAPDSAGQLATIEIANRTGVEHGNNRERALDAAMNTLGVAVMKVRAHDAKRQVLLDALIELGAAEPP